MEDLIIRFGQTEGPRNPTASDVRDALESIESGACRRPEFTIENVSNWKREIINGRRVIRCVLEGRYMSAATFYSEGAPIALGWSVLYHDEQKQGFVLSSGGNPCPELEGICCGAPLKTRASCVVPLPLALAALTYFVHYRNRSPNHEWLARAIGQPFD